MRPKQQKRHILKLEEYRTMEEDCNEIAEDIDRALVSMMNVHPLYAESHDDANRKEIMIQEHQFIQSANNPEAIALKSHIISGKQSQYSSVE